MSKSFVVDIFTLVSVAKRIASAFTKIEKEIGPDGPIREAFDKAKAGVDALIDAIRKGV